MTSEPPLAPFRMPQRLFAELAAGGGSAEAVAFLERAERARRLLLLRTLLDRLDTLPTPLTPAAEAWCALKEAAERAPEPVDRLLLASATGGWIAHVLRRLHGTGAGPPLWAEAGHLNALAVTASLHAGTETDLRIPLTDGALLLPGLGLARLQEPEPGLTVGRARTREGRLTLTGPGASGSPVSSVIRPATVSLPGGRVGAGSAVQPDASWQALRTLTLRTPTASVAIPLDDLDPYRDLDDPLPPARLDEAEAEAWQGLFEEAAGLLMTADCGEPGYCGPGRFDPAAIRAIVPWGRTSALRPAPPTVLLSASSGDSFGGMVIARPSSALALAETLVHEFQHSKLAALLHLFPLLDDDRAERYYAPWRADPRHLTGLLHGAYAFTGVAGFWRHRLAEAPDSRAADEAGYHFALRRLQSRLVARTLLTSGRLTPQGHALVTGLVRTLDGWLREPVPRAALGRARTAAALHRTEWRLRNVVPAPAPNPATPRLRPDRVSWPDVRTHAFATRPSAPRTADEHLAADHPAAAFARYADALAADPAEPHTLAGWIVARAALEPGRAARRMLARPELFPPLPSG
ncbi:HEXXH motif-containing putative peptide modification protein [Streptomyces sp. NPDC001668]|uniref:aKG-HExxH-type peptide beta-hydroxylase n=1 Tax=unclassified Streptomyces TaxID=2593676 RepID=UPI00367BE790